MGDGIEDDVLKYVRPTLGIEVEEAIANNPMVVGAILQENRNLDLAVLGALEHADDKSRRHALEDIMTGLVMEGTVGWAHVRFPRARKALGHLVIGKNRYFSPYNPQD
jgi:hypothetical protein